jgi:tetratricopeptide (TPR) repeat protein
MPDVPNFTQTPDADAARTDSDAHLPQTLGDPAAALTNTPLASPDRYDLGEEIAHGGMGVVYRATDMRLGREVAVKVLREKYGLASEVVRRFDDEARITGQLQHPAIPPVHDLGTLPDGRPFLAMKLIRGRNLDELLAERPDPAHERGRFVAVFEQVCQAVAYAHAHKVLHRDLKPSNVMVGTYGEVQVMDWGLAKVLDAQPTATADPWETSSGTAISSLREADGMVTKAGSVLGSPPFMPPEQALGAIKRIDPRSDVFGLGAILAVILTGTPPFVGGSAETIRIQAAQGQVEECFTRLDVCGADPELVGLCKRCLAPKQEQRPANAGEVARAVADLRAAADERARRAELDRVKAEGEKVAAALQAAEQRKRRRVQLALGAALGVLLLGVGVVAWARRAEVVRQERDERERRVRNAEAVAASLDQSEAALRAEDSGKAAVTFGAAEKRAAEGGAEDLAGRLDGLRADLVLLRDLEVLDQFRWTPVGNRIPDAKELAARYRTALGRFAADPEVLTAEEVAARVRASAVRDRLVAALDHLLVAEKSDRVRAALQVIDPDRYRDEVRDAMRAGDGAKVAQLAGRSEGLEQPPGFVAVLGENRAIPAERRRELLRAALKRRPGDLTLLMTLGLRYPINQREGADERLRWFQAAVAVAPANTVVHDNLGVALLDRGDRVGAEAEFREALRIDPHSANTHNNLGWTLQQNGDLDGAIAEYKAALRLNARFAMAHNNLGWALVNKKDADGAIAEYQEALRIDPRLALSHLGLGMARQQKGDLDGAIAEYDKAILLDPNLAWAHNNLGWARQQQGNLDGAIAEYQEALRIDPRLTQAHFNFGLALRLKGDLDGAIVEYKNALRIDPNFADAHNNLGWTLQQKGDLDGAIAEYQETLRIAPKHSGAVWNLPRAERMRELFLRLPGILAGTATPATPAEACEFANLCRQPFQRRYAAAVRLFEGAFVADPTRAADLAASHRYDAACSAAQAARGDGVDAPVDPGDRAALRAKALGWLHADLALRKKQAASASAAERKKAIDALSWWLRDTDLSGVRPGVQRIGMPAEERAAWDALWADVKATLAEAQKPTPSPQVAPPSQPQE